MTDQRDGRGGGHHHPQRALDGPGGALADQALPGQPDRAQDDDRRQVGEVDRVAQRADQLVHGVLQPGQDVVARGGLVDGDRHPVDGFRRVEDDPGHVVADQRRHVRTLQAVGGPELAGHPVVVVQRLAARGRGRRLHHVVDAAGGLLGLGQRGLADVVQVAKDPGRALRAQPDQPADVADARHLAHASGRPRHRGRDLGGQGDLVGALRARLGGVCSRVGGGQRGGADPEQRSGDQQDLYRPACGPGYPSGAAGPVVHAAGMRAALGRGERDKHRGNSW